MISLFLVLITILGYASSSLNPQSMETIAANDFDKYSLSGMSITDDIGVYLLQSDDDDDDLGGYPSFLRAFNVGSNFSLVPGDQTLTFANCFSRLIPVSKNTFLVHCSAYWPTEAGIIFHLVSVDSDGFMKIVRSQTFASSFNSNNLPILPQSVITTVHGDIYLVTPNSSPSQGEMMTVYRFEINSFDLTIVVPSVEALFPAASGRYVWDFHSLPGDEGVIMIISDEQMQFPMPAGSQNLIFMYFNGTVINYNVSSDVVLVSIGRDAGSSFGYTLEVAGNDTIITSWNLEDVRSGPINNVTVYGAATQYWNLDWTNSHFATSTDLFLVTCDLPKCLTSNLYELPYSEIGFIPNQVSSVSFASGYMSQVLGSGDDGTYVYVCASQSIMRWMY